MNGYISEFLGEEATAEKYHICFLMCLKFLRLLFPVHYVVKQNTIQWSNVTFRCKCSCSGSAGGKTATGDNHKAH